ncbi:KfrB domain-containing protein [Cupriavidus sp. D39]|uniref:KfrB domain-containing protein n=1 Tax=Cupriavidus sp. D39 TaxID=2997877 RepID=UPI00227125A8|nr:TrfB-related DNA-binding protein [Cupriavidus sp. D39]MCY0853051.1 TrfB-related DNA-binding protein [Cupriavidus sp. D39]
MNEREFDNLVNTTRLTPKSREAARLVYVDGKSPSEAGIAVGLSPQRISQILAAVKKAESERPLSVAPNTPVTPVDAVRASYAFAVKAARDLFGDEATIRTPGPDERLVGRVEARTDFHLVQHLGRNAVAIHDLASLDRVPPLARSVAIQYRAGAAQVIDRDQVQTRESNVR